MRTQSRSWPHRARARHLLTEVEHLVDDVVVINRGRLVTSGSLAALTGSVRQSDPRVPTASSRLLVAIGARVETDGDDVLVAVTGLTLAQIGDAAHAAGVARHELSPGAGSLEDVFFTLTTSTANITGGPRTMSSINLVRSELRQLTTTRMPWAFAAVLLLLAVINGIAVAVGTDMDGSKTFVSTGADQQSLMAFAANALLLAAVRHHRCRPHPRPQHGDRHLSHHAAPVASPARPTDRHRHWWRGPRRGRRRARRHRSGDVPADHRLRVPGVGGRGRLAESSSLPAGPALPGRSSVPASGAWCATPAGPWPPPSWC